jgi:hypothetical protein
MITLLRRHFARRRLKPIVNILPRRLARAFGTSEHYTYAQAKRAISDLGLRKSLQPYAFAAACQLQELANGDAPFSRGDYLRVRIELADLFDLPDPHFTIKDLLANPYSVLAYAYALPWRRWIRHADMGGPPIGGGW